MPRPINTKKCNVDGCNKLQKSRAMCQSHYSQWRRTGKTTQVNERQDVHSDGWRYCVGCTYWSPVDQFSYRSDSVGKVLSSKCSRCKSLARHNITGIDFDRLLFAQKGRCGGCGVYADAGTRLHVDHDHRCCPQSNKTCGKCIRGLLCESCNWTLGKVKDEPQRLLDLVAYLERTK